MEFFLFFLPHSLKVGGKIISSEVSVTGFYFSYRRGIFNQTKGLNKKKPITIVRVWNFDRKDQEYDNRHESLSWNMYPLGLPYWGFGGSSNFTGFERSG